MNKYHKTDRLDLQLYAAMPYAHSKDVDIYDAVQPMEIPEKSRKRILKRIRKRIRQ